MTPNTQNILDRLTMIVQQCPEGICLIDRRHVVEYANTAWANMHGFDSAAELIGLPLRTFHSDVYLKQEVYPFLQMVERIGQYQQQLHHRRNDQRDFTAETIAMILTDEDHAVTGYLLFADRPEDQPQTSTRRNNMECFTG